DSSNLILVTKRGLAKKVEAKSFHDVRHSGLIAVKLSRGDELISAHFIDKGDTVVIVTKKGQAIRFKESDIRTMGRTAAGVRAIKLASSDRIINAGVVLAGSKSAEVLVLSKRGFGKKTKISEYKVQKRGGSGIKTAKVTDKTGVLITSEVVNGEEGELVAISQKGQVIRVGLDEIPSLGRQTQGVRVMKLRPGDSIASLVCL
ncbi:DNA gyrase subunit A, partial [Patescibacteria group bacterium]|nr:DNA gyrase subunit A [Patescibacteria group bacterium]